MKQCGKCGGKSIIWDRDNQAQSDYLKCLSCGSRNIEEVENTKLNNFEIFEREESSMSRATRYDQAFKDAAVEQALEVEMENGKFVYSDAERIGTLRGCSGASVWQWWQKKRKSELNERLPEQLKQKDPLSGTGAKVSGKPFTQPPAEKKNPAKSEYVYMIERLIEKYDGERDNAAAKAEGLRQVLQDLAA